MDIKPIAAGEAYEVEIEITQKSRATGARIPVPADTIIPAWISREDKGDPIVLDSELALERRSAQPKEWFRVLPGTLTAAALDGIDVGQIVYFTCEIDGERRSKALVVGEGATL